MAKLKGIAEATHSQIYKIDVFFVRSLANLPLSTVAANDCPKQPLFEEEKMKQKALKSTLGISAVATLMVALFGGDLAWSYWQGFQGLARNSLKDATSIEFAMQRLHQGVDGLKSTLLKNRKIAAKLEVEIKFLADDTKRIQNTQELAKAEMDELRKALNGNDNIITIDDLSLIHI